MALKLVPASVHPASQPRKLLFVFPVSWDTCSALRSIGRADPEWS